MNICNRQERFVSTKKLTESPTRTAYQGKQTCWTASRYRLLSRWLTQKVLMVFELRIDWCELIFEEFGIRCRNVPTFLASTLIARQSLRREKPVGSIAVNILFLTYLWIRSPVRALIVSSIHLESELFYSQSIVTIIHHPEILLRCTFVHIGDTYRAWSDTRLTI